MQRRSLISGQVDDGTSQSGFGAARGGGRAVLYHLVAEAADLATQLGQLGLQVVDGVLQVCSLIVAVVPVPLAVAVVPPAVRTSVKSVAIVS